LVRHSSRLQVASPQWLSAASNGLLGYRRRADTCVRRHLHLGDCSGFRTLRHNLLESSSSDVKSRRCNGQQVLFHASAAALSPTRSLLGPAVLESQHLPLGSAPTQQHLLRADPLSRSNSLSSSNNFWGSPHIPKGLERGEATGNDVVGFPLASQRGLREE
jgi:hypothetical protein